MKWKPYPAYKDFGVEWLGHLPESWGVISIKQSTYLKGRVGWKGLKSDEYLEDGFAYLVTGTDFYDRYIHWENCHCVDQERFEDDPYIQLENGDLLITKDGTIGKLALVKNLDRAACLNSGIFLIRPVRAYITTYMYWVLSSKSFSLFCDLYSFGSTIQHLYQNVFEEFSFPTPSIDEQKKISSFLDRQTAKLDTLISKQERLIELLQERIIATVSNALVSDDSQLIRLSHVCDIIFRPVIQNSEDSYVRLGLLNRGRGIFKRDETDSDDMGESDFFWVEKGDLIISGQFAWEGAVALADEEHSGCVVSHRFPIIRGKEGIVLTEYLLGLFMTSFGDFILNENSRGSAGRNRPLNLSLLLKEKIPIPPLAVQSEVAKLIHLKKQLVDKSKRLISFVQEHRSALISAAVIGKIDVREAA